MRNIADVTGGKPIAVRSQSISGGSAVNLLVALYGIHGRMEEMLSIIPFRTPQKIILLATNK
jgi:cystathionine beta-lyase family protein involved in aluminum resistance